MKSDENNRNIMTFTGEGKVTAVPDLAVIRLGVETAGEPVERLQEENARATQAILQALSQMGISDIKTFQYTIDRNYEFENGRRMDRGYIIRNILEVRTNQLDLVGRIIDTAVSQGANTVEFISFEISKEDQYYQEALNLAVENAYQKAQSVANFLGFTFHPIPRRIVESRAIPYTDTLQIRREFAETPILPGNIEIQAMVTVEFIYG